MVNKQMAKRLLQKSKFQQRRTEKVALSAQLKRQSRTMSQDPNAIGYATRMSNPEEIFESHQDFAKKYTRPSKTNPKTRLAPMISLIKKFPLVVLLEILKFTLTIHLKHSY
ncbi:hypothetical protein [Enterococcus dongliensis]|uniref:hypothetical protein n=1 Tax=Enterococcus dongliensis TaxID=2559925 RepID=UPI00288EBFA4|nr:hypothetical protein [Enterococcus dongliensis]MDT2613288.1 hypothetical protein [Enterococcus dongliensis]